MKPAKLLVAKLLVRHFLRAFFRGDGVAQGADPRAVAVAAAAMFAAPGMFICMMITLGGIYVDGTPELAFFIALSMLLSGLLAVVAWDRLLLEATDFHVLGTLPLSTRTIAGAKLAALAALVAVFVFIVNVYSCILLPLVTTPEGGTPRFLRNIGAQAFAVAAASLWMFLMVLAARAILAAMGRRFDPLARALRLWLTVALISALALAPDLMGPGIYARLSGSSRPWTQPLFWFVGLDRWAAGVAAPAWQARGREALLALGLAATAAVVGFLLACRRQSRTAVLPARPPRAASAGRRWRGFARTPEHARGRACFRFARAALTRSRPHGLRLSLWLGAGVAVIVANLANLEWQRRYASSAQIQSAALDVPLVLCFFLVLGLRQAIAIPIFPEANWIFRLTETGPQPERWGAARRLLWLYGAAPVLVLALPFAAYLWNWRAAMLHTAYCAALVALLIEILLLGLRKLPFTCPYVPGRANFKYLWPVYWLLFSFFAYGTAALAYRLRPQPLPWLSVTVCLAAAAGIVYRANRSQYNRLDGAQFEDSPDPAVQTLFTP